MFFRFGYELKNFLIPDFDIESPLGLLTTCIVTSVLVIVFESLKTSRVIKKLKFYTYDGRSLFRLAFYNSTEKSTLIERSENVKEIWRISDIVYHFFELLIGYLLMLMAMTYNAYVMISIGIGAAVAYLITGTAIMNITAQVVARKMCMGCHSKVGECTPIAELLNEGPSTSSGAQMCDIMDKDDSTTTIQIHI